MAGRGGPRPGSGRPKGRRNKKNQHLDEAKQSAKAKIEAAISEPFEGDAHALLMAVYKDPDQPVAVRIDAAKAAIRFEKPALVATEITNDITRHYVARMPAQVPDINEWQRQNQNLQ